MRPKNPVSWLHLIFWFQCCWRIADSLVCYACTSTLSSTVDEAGQVALRVFLDSTYQLPSVHRLCNMEDDVDFKTLPVSQCSYKDNCIKISASNQGKLLNYSVLVTELYHTWEGSREGDG